MRERRVDRNFYNYRERERDELFPWDFIDIGVSKNFLWREYERAKAGEVTPNCRARCSGCGAAVFGTGVCVESRGDSGAGRGEKGGIVR